MISATKTEINKLHCSHCNELCEELHYDKNNNPFCCNGCQTVYELLQENELACFYDVNQNAGISLKAKPAQKFDFLEDPSFADSYLSFQNENTAKVTFQLPSIHCAACIWLLERLYKFNAGILNSRANFNQKSVSITYSKTAIRLKEIAYLLDQLGYTPSIDTENKANRKSPFRKLWLQIGIAGFAFGNSMLFSLPEYFGLKMYSGETVALLFTYLNALLALPVLLYSAQDYLRSAWNISKTKRINMDLPISLGIISLFLYSYYLIFFQEELGYIDSFTGLIFFLLLGKYYQQKTFDHLRFDRDVKSFFPLSVSKIEAEKESQVLLSKVLADDILKIRNEEIIPADSLLLSDRASIDYSFVTGESILEEKQREDLLYAGGRLKGNAILIQVKNRPSQSQLSQLWDDELIGQSKSEMQSIADKVSTYFTLIILFIAMLGATYWLVQSQLEIAIRVFCTVLIVACPCALALATPVSLGYAIRALAKFGFFVKNTQSIENLAQIDTVVFDKTGTLTYPDKALVQFIGELPEHQHLAAISTLLNQSRHPLSKIIYNWLPHYPAQELSNYQEIVGKGLSGEAKGAKIKLGKNNFVEDKQNKETKEAAAKVYVRINDKVYGHFQVKHVFREGMQALFQGLNRQYETHLISGDNDADIQQIKEWIKQDNIQFHQLPGRKKLYIEALQEDTKNVLMVGDGLNDAGALKASHVGLAVTESTSQFSPACDVICLGANINLLPQILRFSKKGVIVIMIAFLVSFCYNILGLSFALQGMLSPVLAAILMPLSSITVVLISMLGIRFYSSKIQTPLNH